MTALLAVCLVSGAAIAVVVTGVMRRMAPRWGLVDHPNARKVHVNPTPLGGGIGIWCGIVFPLAAAELAAWWLRGMSSLPEWVPAEVAKHLDGVTFRSRELWAILAGGTILAALGLLDDLKSLRWQPRLLVQFIVAAGLVAGGVRATVFSDVPWVGAVLTTMWLVVLTNAFNFLDNMDGLSAGIGLIASLLFAAIMLTGTASPHWFVAGFLLVIAGSLAGFLVHNWSPAKIFMGDTGSCFIGILLASATVVGTFYDYGQTSRHVIFAPLCVLAVPLYDFCSVVLIRVLQGRSPFHPDKCHFSHRLVELGLTPPRAVLTIFLVTLTTGLGGLLLYQVNGWPGAALVMGLIGCVLAVVAILETAGRGK